MGGNAIKQTFVRRYARVEFEALSTEVLEKLAAFAGTVYSDFQIIPYYRNKPSFGDMDVILRSTVPKSEIDHSHIIDVIYALFGTLDVSVNDGVYSFPYKELQIDLVFTNPEDYESSIAYFSYNDLGNLLGRIAKSAFNVSYGHKGLHFKARETGSHLVQDITITKDTGEILKLLGLNHETFLKGFDELQEIYDYVVSSPFFRKSFFNLDSLNHINRVRNRKRASYMGFLLYIKDLPDLPEIDLFDCGDRLYRQFPWLLSDIVKCVGEANRIAAIKNAARNAAKFHFGLDNGSAIRQAMVAFRKELENKPQMTPEYAAQWIFIYKSYGHNTEQQGSDNSTD